MEDKPRPPQREAARITAEREHERLAKLNYAGADAAGPSRERYWHECGIEEKVERVRNVLANLEHITEVMAKRSAEALKIAKFHEHGIAGNVVVPTMEAYPSLTEVEFNVRGIFRLLHNG